MSEEFPKDSKKNQQRLSQADEIVILRRIADLMSEELELSHVLSEVVELVEQATQADSVFIYLFDEHKQNLILQASKVSHDRELGNVILKVGEGITGWAAQKNEMVSIKRKAYADSRFKNFDVLPEDQYEAFLSLPIVYKNNPIGVINIQHKEANTHRKRMVDLIMAIANNVGGIIENARLYRESKLKVNRFESLLKISESITSEQYLEDILNLIVVVTAELLNSKICSIMLVDDKKKHLVLKAAQSLSEQYRNKPPISITDSLSGDVVMSQRAKVIYDVKCEERYRMQEMASNENLSSMILVPMIIHNKAIGVVNVYTKEPHSFTQDEVDTLQIIANHAAVTIENRGLMEENLKTKEALDARKYIERAKGILMKAQNVDEETAYRIIHKRSMDSCRSMKEIAEAIILTMDIKPNS